MDDQDWMRLAVEQARKGIASGGSPFGAVVVRGDELVSANHNEVWHTTDPTAHAEIVAIRRAASNLRKIDLSGCRMFTTCEPCPMCASAIHWARIDEVYFGASIADAQLAGFNELDLAIDELYRRGGSPVKLNRGLLAAECAGLFKEFLQRNPGKTY